MSAWTQAPAFPGPPALPGPGIPRSALLSFASVSSGELRSLTTCDCELALLPLEQLLALQACYLRQEPAEAPETLASFHYDGGGYNLFSDGSFSTEDRDYSVINYISRNADLTSHLDYKNYRETILSKPMLFLTTARKESPFKEMAFAFIVNTRHPKMRAQIEGGMDRIIFSSGESYKLQFDFQNVVKDFFAREGYVTQGEGLSFSYEFKVDAFFDIRYMLGFSNKKVDVNGRIMNLFSKNPEKKKVVKLFLSKMSEPCVKRGQLPDRRFSTFSTSTSFDDDAFRSPRPSIDMTPRPSIDITPRPSIDVTPGPLLIEIDNNLPLLSSSMEQMCE